MPANGASRKASERAFACSMSWRSDSIRESGYCTKGVVLRTAQRQLPIDGIVRIDTVGNGTQWLKPSPLLA